MAPDPRAFRTLREGWSDYRMRDGALVRVKLILGFWDQDVGTLQGLSVGNVVVAWTPPSLRRPQEAAVGLGARAAVAVEADLPFEKVADGASEYAAGPLVLTLRPTAERFSLGSGRGADGSPQYLVRHSVEITTRRVKAGSTAAKGSAPVQRPAKPAPRGKPAPARAKPGAKTLRRAARRA